MNMTTVAQSFDRYRCWPRTCFGRAPRQGSSNYDTDSLPAPILGATVADLGRVGRYGADSRGAMCPTESDRGPPAGGERFCSPMV